MEDHKNVIELFPGMQRFVAGLLFTLNLYHYFLPLHESFPQAIMCFGSRDPFGYEARFLM
jgi:hypothetical protein